MTHHVRCSFSLVVVTSHNYCKEREELYDPLYLKDYSKCESMPYIDNIH